MRLLVIRHVSEHTYEDGFHICIKSNVLMLVLVESYLDFRGYFFPILNLMTSINPPVMFDYVCPDMYMMIHVICLLQN